MKIQVFLGFPVEPCGDWLTGPTGLGPCPGWGPYGPIGPLWAHKNFKINVTGLVGSIGVHKGPQVHREP